MRIGLYYLCDLLETLFKMKQSDAQKVTLSTKLRSAMKTVDATDPTKLTCPPPPKHSARKAKPRPNSVNIPSSPTASPSNDSPSSPNHLSYAMSPPPPTPSGQGAPSPDHWERVLANIREMRAARDAPVDTMGADQCWDKEAAPEVGVMRATVRDDNWI